MVNASKDCDGELLFSQVQGDPENRRMPFGSLFVMLEGSASDSDRGVRVLFPSTDRQLQT